MGLVGAGPAERLGLEWHWSSELEPFLSGQWVDRILLGALFAMVLVLSLSHLTYHKYIN